MAITVICPSCRASFKVDDKYAGREGPCPKCKTKITIPKVEKVVIHEEGAASTTAAAAATGQAKTGAQSVKPIARTEVQFRVGPAIGIGLAIVATFVLALVLHNMLLKAPALRVIGLFAVAIPSAIGSYAILRNDELEPYRGGALWVRTLIVALVYAGLWVAFYYVPTDIKAAAYNWAFIVPVMVVVGGAAATLLYDLDFGSGVFHCIIFLTITTLLGYVAKLGWPWADALTKVNNLIM